MSCCFTACELWKIARRGYVPMDIYNAREASSNGCGCNCSNCGCNNGCGCVEQTDTSVIDSSDFGCCNNSCGC